MNAIIALCHFCEAHGPCPIFCTQTIRDSKIDDLLFNFELPNKKCPGCDSVGESVAMVSEDDESNASFLSGQMPAISDSVSLVKQAAVRSLSCEINNANSDGNTVFFGDATRGHVLSHTFHIHDSQARGFFRLFSIVILMKDKMFLLNLQPFLAKNMQKISSELQSYSLTVYTAEQAKCSERAQRLTSGQASTQPPRSLIELTNESSIFAILHTHFTWILSTGARYLTENVTVGAPSVPPWIAGDEDGFSVVNMDNEEWLLHRQMADNETKDYSIRKCRELLKTDFISTCYCVLVGTQVVLRGPPEKTMRVMKCMRKLIPEYLHKLVKIDANEYVPSSGCRILCIGPQVAVPQPCSSVLRIDFIGDDDEISVKWLGELPAKHPDLLVKILKAIDEKLFNDNVLGKHIRVLVEEWKNKVACMKKISSNQELIKMKKVLGVQQQDQNLVNYWSNFL